jgi:hypothetical protein
MNLDLNNCSVLNAKRQEITVESEKVARRAYLISRMLGRLLVQLDAEFGEYFDRYDETRVRKLIDRGVKV